MLYISELQKLVNLGELCITTSCSLTFTSSSALEEGPSLLSNSLVPHPHSVSLADLQIHQNIPNRSSFAIGQLYHTAHLCLLVGRMPWLPCGCSNTKYVFWASSRIDFEICFPQTFVLKTQLLRRLKKAAMKETWAFIIESPQLCWSPTSGAN